MIIFHEGMPRSGKSYEAMTLQIIPALKAGRPVDAYIEGLNFERIAECADLPLDRVRELLTQMTAEQVPEFYKHIRPNALVVLDEAQDFWPTGRLRLDPETTKAITQHGHLGQDILLMGQVLGDVHKLWRGRVSQKNFYLKLDAVGAEKRYSVTVYKATRPERFEKVTFSSGKYDPAFFGTYASHVDGSISTANFKDGRANLRNTFFVKFGLPLAAVAGLLGAWGTWRFFHPPTPAPVVVKSPEVSADRRVEPSQIAPGTAVVAKPRKPFIEDLNDRFRPRLSLLYERGGAYVGAVEWWDGDQLRERLTFVQIVTIGATVDVRGNLVKVAGTWVTPWEPIRHPPTTASTLAPAVNLVAAATTPL